MLDIALSYDLTELDFWDMTIAEVKRAVKSKIKIKKLELKERATFDYIQARLIAKGVSIAFGDKSEFPGLEESYPGIFTDQEEMLEKKAKQEEAKTQLSVLRFKQFANFHNKKYEEVASEK